MDCAVQCRHGMVEQIIIVMWIVSELREIVKKTLCNARFIISSWFGQSTRPANRYPYEWVGSWDEGALTSVPVHIRLTEEVSQVEVLTSLMLWHEKSACGSVESIRQITAISARHALAYEGIDHEGEVPWRHSLHKRFISRHWCDLDVDRTLGYGCYWWPVRDSTWNGPGL